MNLKLDLLRNHPWAIPRLAEIWYDGIAKVWIPDTSLLEIESGYREEIENDLSPSQITFVMFNDNKPVGVSTLKEDDEIRADFRPWLESLVVDKSYRGFGIGKLLTKAVINKARGLSLCMYMYMILHYMSITNILGLKKNVWMNSKDVLLR